MRTLPQVIGRFFWVVVVLGCLAACTTSQLAPQYSQSIVDSIKRSNASALGLFATVSGGSSPAQLGVLRSRYDTIIAEFDTIKIMVRARSVPSLTAKVLRMGALSDVCKTEADANACVNSTASKLQGIVDVLTEMRRTHAVMGLNAAVVAAYKKDYEISVVSALVIETALDR